MNNQLTDFGLNPKNPTNFVPYIGTKTVNAMPMTREQYNYHRGWETPEGENPKDEGYLVEYLDGGKPNHKDHENYISWSPKDVFDKSYKASETFLDRLKIERDEVQTRLDGLNKTLDVPTKPEFISESQWIAMSRQQFHQRQYVQILNERIAEAEGESVPLASGKNESVSFDLYVPLKGSEADLT